MADDGGKKSAQKTSKKRKRLLQMDREEQSPAGKKASPMSRAEMVDMVFMLEKHDYDGKKKTYERPNSRKDLILEDIIAFLLKKHNVKRSKDQLRKRWSDLKLREHKQFHQIKDTLAKSKLIFCKNLNLLMQRSMS